MSANTKLGKVTETWTIVRDINGELNFSRPYYTPEGAHTHNFNENRFNKYCEENGFSRELVKTPDYDIVHLYPKTETERRQLHLF